jgi:tetratricopeptide (TPR) repeat protein
MAKRGELRQVSNGVESAVPLEAPRFTIGRGTNNSLCLSNQSVSRCHAEIIRLGKDYLLRDLGSTNGTFINDTRISEQLLNEGDILRFGSTGPELSFNIVRDDHQVSVQMQRPSTTESLIDSLSQKLDITDAREEVNLRCLLAEAYLTKGESEAAFNTLAKYADHTSLTEMPLNSHARALYWIGRVHIERRQYDRAIEYLRNSLSLYMQVGDDSGIAESQYSLGQALIGVGDLLAARDSLHRALLTARRAGNSRLQAETHILFGRIDWKEGDSEGARYNWSRAAHVAEGTNDALLQARAEYQQGFLLFSEGKVKEAIPVYQSVIDKVEKIGNARFLLKAYNSMSRALIRTGAWAAAERLFEDRLRLAREHSLGKAEAQALTDLAELRCLQGSTSAALNSIQTAIQRLGGIVRPRTQRILGRILSVRAHQHLNAIEEFGKGIEAARAKGNLEEQVLLRLETSLAYLELGEIEKAQAQLALVDSISTLDPALGLMGRVLYTRGRIQAATNQPSEANRSFAQALSIFNGNGDPYREALSHAAIGGLRSRTGRRESARAHLEEAREAFSRLGAATDRKRMETLLASDIYENVVPAMTRAFSRALSLAAPLSMAFSPTSQLTPPAAAPSPNRVLIAEGDDAVASLLVRGLEAENFVVDRVQDGRAAMEMAVSPHYVYDVLILDSLLEYRSGLDVCRDLRKANFDAPVILLGSRLEVEDKIEALQVGADDFISKKNMVFEELLAKMEAL